MQSTGLLLLAILGTATAPSPFNKNHGAGAGGPPFAGVRPPFGTNGPPPPPPGGVAQPPFFGPPPVAASGPSPYRGPNPLHASNGGYPFPAPSLRDAPARNPLLPVFEWNIIDFAYPSAAAHRQALAGGDFVPENNLPLGVDRHGDRVFVTLPRWKNGVPASLAWLPYDEAAAVADGASSPAMRPYPDWSAHGDPVRPDCSKLMSVYRLWIDECERLWVIDAGVVNATIAINQVCPPKIVAFDLRTDRQLFAYELPADQVRQDSLHSNIVVDVRTSHPDACATAHAYVTDVWRYGVVVFSLEAFRSWRTTNHLYLPTPQYSDYTLHGLNFQWTDGVFGVSLGPELLLRHPVALASKSAATTTTTTTSSSSDRIVFFHPMSSYGEFMVSAAVLQNETLWTVAGGQGAAAAFVQIGERGVDGQSSASGIDRSGVQFFNLIQQDSVGCWDTARPYDWAAVGVVARDNQTLVFPNDMKLDRGLEQQLWVLSNRLPIYLYAQLDFGQVNFRIQRVAVADAVRGTVCDRRRVAENAAGPYATAGAQSRY